MSTFALRYRDEQIQAAITALGDRAPKAISRALNRAATSTRAMHARQIAADMRLKVGSVREQLKIRNARPDDLVARISASGKRLPLTDFGARQTRKGVTANTGKGRTLIPAAFIATMGSGHVGVFKREKPGERRSPGAWSLNLPIQQKFGPSLPHVFSKLTPAAIAHGEEALKKNLAHELSWALKQSAQQ